eukprot:6892230-Alexandrium_andersonii.AAC.1
MCIRDRKRSIRRKRRNAAVAIERVRTPAQDVAKAYRDHVKFAPESAAEGLTDTYVNQCLRVHRRLLSIPEC